MDMNNNLTPPPEAGKEKTMKQTQKHKSKAQQLIAAALQLLPASTRSGGMSGHGSYYPIPSTIPYGGTGRSHSHKGYVRTIKKAQRRRAFYKSLRT